MSEKPIKVTDIEHLKKLCSGEDIGEFYILLNFGIRSSKDMQWYPQKKKFWVRNCVDDSEQNLTEKQLFTKSHIGDAIREGAFYMYP